MLQLSRVVRRSPAALRSLRVFCSLTEEAAHASHHQKPEEELSVSERVQKQIFQAGLQFLKGDIEELKRNVALRKGNTDMNKLIQLHRDYNDLLHSIRQLRHKRNVNAKQFTAAKTTEERDQLVHRGAELKRAITDLEAQKLTKEQELIPELSLIPNNSHPDVPHGSYENAKVVCIHNNKPEFSFPPKEHTQIGELLDLFDFSSASQASGHSFYYLKGPAAMLEMALIQYALHKATSKGYHPIITPDIIKTDVVEGCGFHPRGPMTQVYAVSSQHGHLCLSGTAEIPLAGMFMDRVIPLEKLPIRVVAFGRCFRAEAGGYGHAVRGLYRVHQFSKVELFGVTASETGDESSQLLEELLSLQREILDELGLHYRVLDMPTEELGTPAYRKYDIEAWMPGRGEYGEVTSASNCTEFQSRRLRITYPNPARKSKRDPGRKYAHTVNGTACAIPRTIIALLENYQKEDGSVVLPEVLHPFLPPHYWHIGPATTS